MPDYITWLAAAVCIINFACLSYVLRTVQRISKERDMYRQKYAEASERIPRLVKLAYGDTDEPEEI